MRVTERFPILLIGSFLAATLPACDNGGSPSSPTSPTGSSEWTTQIARTEPDPDLLAVAWDPTNAKFEIGGDRGYQMNSADGDFWTLTGWNGDLKMLGYASTTAGLFSIESYGTSGALRNGTQTYYSFTRDVTAVTAGAEAVIVVGRDGLVAKTFFGNDVVEYDAGTTEDLTDVVWDAGRFYASGADGSIRNSTNGEVWTLTAQIPAMTIRAISVHGSWIVALGGNGEILQSQNSGQTWKTVGGSGYQAIEWMGTYFMAVGNGGEAITSSTPDAWHAVRTGTTQTLRAVTRGSRVIVVGDAGTILTTNSGLQWNTAQPARPGTISDLIWTGEMLVAGIDFADTPKPIVYSTDGVHWTPAESVEDPRSIWGIHSLGWSGSVAVAMATAFGGQGVPQHTTLYASTDVRNWHIVHQANGSHYGYYVFWTGSEFVVPLQNEILRSPDGNVWTSSPLTGYEKLQDFYAVTKRDDMFYGVEWDGTLRASSDLQFWTKVGVAGRGAYDVTWTGAEFLVASSTAVWSSPDGATWQSNDPGTKSELWTVVSSDKQWVVGGDGALIRTRNR